MANLSHAAASSSSSSVFFRALCAMIYLNSGPAAINLMMLSKPVGSAPPTPPPPSLPTCLPTKNVHIMVAFIFIYNFCRQQNEISNGKERGGGRGGTASANRRVGCNKIRYITLKAWQVRCLSHLFLFPLRCTRH